jgi:Ni/Co efflux regulator RcnB
MVRAGTKEVLKMKGVVNYLSAVAMGIACAIAAYAQSPAAATSAQADPALIAQLEKAEQQDIADGRNSNKNNPAFGQKAYQVNQLIDRLKRGDQVSPSDIDNALEPAHVW